MILERRSCTAWLGWGLVVFGRQCPHCLCRGSPSRTRRPRARWPAPTADAFFKIKDRDWVLGKHSIDANGDTTLSSYGGNTVRGGRIVFTKVITVQPHA